eukprot:11160663-Lingulodinium_polyedra.AAC.1
MDHTLSLVLGQGLERFIPRSPPESPSLLLHDTLVLHMDEGSPGYSAGWFLLYSTKARCVLMKDIYH